MRLEDLPRQALTDQVDPPHYHLLEVLRAIRKAKKDDKIIGIFIKGGLRPPDTVAGMRPFASWWTASRTLRKAESR